MLLKNIMQERAMLKSKDVDAIKSAKSEILTGKCNKMFVIRTRWAVCFLFLISVFNLIIF